MLLGVLAILAASYAFPVRAWLDQREQLSALGAQREALAAEVEVLQDSRDLWNVPAYVRGQARQRLNYVLPGEVGIVVLGTESTPPEEPVTGTLVPAATDGQEWWSTLVSAFVAVGVGPPEQAAAGAAAEAEPDGTGADPAGGADGDAAGDAAAGVTVVALDARDEHHARLTVGAGREHRREDVVVGEVAAAVVRVVGDEHVARPELVDTEELELGAATFSGRIDVEASASTWSFIRAMSGEITRVVPPTSRADSW